MVKAKKWLALGLTAAMVLGMSGCGSDKQTVEESKQESSSQAQQEASKTEESKETEEAKEPVTLSWWYYGNGIQKDTEKVQEAVNELIKTYPGMEHVSVKLNPRTGGNYANDVLLAQASGEQMDLIHTYRLNFAEEVEKGTFIALDDLIDAHPNLKNELPEWLWDLGSVDGTTYIVPGYQRAANQMYFVTPKAYMDKYGNIDEMREILQSDPKDINVIAPMLEEYIVAVREGEGETKYAWPLATNYISPTMGTKNRVDKIYGNNFVKYADRDTVECTYMMDEVVKAYEISAEWYQKGYIHPDVLSINDLDFDRKNLVNEVSYIYGFNNQAGDEEAVSAYYTTAYGLDVYAIPLWKNYYLEHSWAAGGFGIGANSEHPEEAIRLLELMCTEEGVELYNMMVYGLEDVHYTKIDDTHIKTLEYDGTQGGEDTSYAAMKWVMGNTFHAYLNQGCNDNDNEIARFINEDPSNDKTELMGFILKTDAVTTQLEQTQAIIKEYDRMLTSGALGDDWKKTYDEFVEKMNKAGLQDILNDFQAQVDAFLAK